MSELPRVSEALISSGLETVELLLKEGRSRRVTLGSEGRLVSMHRERGWAVRASGEQCSLFSCGSGDPVSAGPWPSPDGFPIRLPSPRPVPAWREPADLRSPLALEHEVVELLEACERELVRELPMSRLLRASLEDGESGSTIANTRGIECGLRLRTATLHLEAALGDAAVSEFVGERTVREFNPRALARRLADRLVVRRDGSPGGRDRSMVLLAPPVAIRILASLLPLFVDGNPGFRRILADSGRRIASPLVTIVDDGRFEQGLFAAPVDGEGMPTGRVVLVERGLLRRPLAGSRSDQGGSPRVYGHVRRPSYRDLPAVGPSHLFVEPDHRRPAGALLAELSRGYYLLESQDAGRFDFARDRFQLTVGGFAVRAGSPTRAISRTRLSGRISRLLIGVQAVARDLTFAAVGGLLGSPSLLVEGLELDGA